MIEIERKILAIVLALAVVLFVSPMVGPVFAGKGQTRQSFEFSYKEYPLSEDGPDSHASPRGLEGADLRTMHGRDCIHLSEIYDAKFEIDGVEDTRFTITGRDGGCNYEFNSKTMTVIHKATENLTLSSESDGTVQGTIVLSIIEKIDWITMVSEGTFVGFGTGIFEDVKIVGTAGSELDFVTMKLEITLVGTVMGWPE